VEFCVLTVGKRHQVVRVVIGSIAVDVMDMLMGLYPAA
jgi:hypothetical protein